MTVNMKSKNNSQFIINSKVKENLKGKTFNPYCTCHNRSCNGVKKTQQGKYFFYFTNFNCLKNLLWFKGWKYFHLVCKCSISVEICQADSTTADDSNVTVAYSDNASDSDGPLFVFDVSSEESDADVN